ncbi:uncharacterized protein LOC106065653 [Biomphalaria glabrata]|uniref:Uncharacterized protein LOC106065653 n=1 Tax=Biomphalaria glabrata TaxID=6526 RepID=A0A9W3A7E6_BIOGL|nr:uncharacterized protein LOC106065653 [Biomphalaria glabrata]
MPTFIKLERPSEIFISSLSKRMMFNYRFFGGILIVFITVDVVFSADRCRLTNMGSVRTNQTIHNKPVLYKTVPENCTEGEFDWDWPQGYIYLSSTLGRPHSLCVQTTEFGAVMLGGVSDVTGGKDVPLALPTQDHPACSIATSGKAELLISAFSTQIYWTTFGYRVNLL